MKLTKENWATITVVAAFLVVIFATRGLEDFLLLGSFMYVFVGPMFIVSKQFDWKSIVGVVLLVLAIILVFKLGGFSMLLLAIALCMVTSAFSLLSGFRKGSAD